MDLVVHAARRPDMGETVIATDSSLFVGGKGLNQAVGAARSDAETTLIGRIGRDPFGMSITQALDRSGVSRAFLIEDPDVMTGIGLPLIDPAGANSIVFVSGANGRVDVSDIHAAAPAIKNADMLLLQLELPVETAVEAAQLAGKLNTKVLLNTAPAVEVPSPLVGLADLVVANEIEARQLAGEHGSAGIATVAQHLFRTWRPAAMLVTLGADGVLVCDSRGLRTFSAFRVDPVDTVGAGDAFCAGLAVELSRGANVDRALAYAQASAALSVTRRGAEASIPRRNEIEDFLRKQGRTDR